MSAVEKFLKYVTYDTRSEEDQENIPSTEKQFDLARELVEEMKSMGIADARVDEHCYVYGTIPATTERKVPVRLPPRDASEGGRQATPPFRCAPEQRNLYCNL